MKTFDDLNEIGWNAIRTVDKHLPEICLGIGIVSGVAAVGTAVYATFKTDRDLDYLDSLELDVKRNEELYSGSEKRDEALEAAIEESKRRYNEEKKKTVWKVIKNYSLTAVLTGVSVGADILGYSRQKKEIGNLLKSNAELTAAFQALNVFTSKYRRRVIDELGVDADERFATGIETREIEEEVTDKKGNVKIVKRKIQTVPGDPGMYARLLSQSPRFEKDDDYNILTIESIQAILNRRLKDRGYLFLNEVYREFGWPEVSYGHKIGWVYDPKNEDSKGDNYIEFRCKAIKTQDPVTGRWFNDYLINFNFDGIIEDYVWDERRGTQPNMMTPDGGVDANPGIFHPGFEQKPFN